MRAFSIYLLVCSFAVLGLACSKKSEPAPEYTEVSVPSEALPPAPSDDRVQPEVDADPGLGVNERTPQAYAPSEAPPPIPTDHRVRLGIDGDPGFEQNELTPEELAAARAAGERSPGPSYGAEPSGAESSEPSDREQTGDVAYEDDAVDTVYVGGRRDPVRRKRAREHSPAAPEPSRVDRAPEPAPVDRPHEPAHANPPHAGPHR